jgi:hypothetical protein
VQAKNKNFGSLGIAGVVAPAVALLGGGSPTAARTGGSPRRFPMSQNFYHKGHEVHKGFQDIPS